MQRFLEPQMLVWIPIGYVVLWVFCWRHAPSRGTKLGGPFADPSNRVAVVRFSGLVSLMFLAAPVFIFPLLTGNPHKDTHLYYPLFMLGVAIAYAHIRFRKWG